MGEVYRARDSRLDRDVAIKVLPEHLSQNPQALARFEREAKAVAALSHPNILSIHDVGEEQGVRFAVTEVLDGETLRNRLEIAMPWDKAVEIGIAVADGLAAAHAAGAAAGRRRCRPSESCRPAVRRQGCLAASLEP